MDERVNNGKYHIRRLAYVMIKLPSKLSPKFDWLEVYI